MFQHLAAATAMGRAHHLGRREGHRTRPSSHGHQQFLVLSTPPPGAVPPAGGGTEPAATSVGNPSTPLTSEGDEQLQQIPSLQTQNSSPAPGCNAMASTRQGVFSNDR